MEIFSISVLNKFKSAYNKCIKTFFGLKRPDSMSGILLDLPLPSVDTIFSRSVHRTLWRVMQQKCTMVCFYLHMSTVRYIDLLSLSFFYLYAHCVCVFYYYGLFVKILMLEKRNSRNFTCWLWFYLLKRCNFLTLTLRLPIASYYGQTIQWKTELKYLGIHRAYCSF